MTWRRSALPLALLSLVPLAGCGGGDAAPAVLVPLPSPPRGEQPAATAPSAAAAPEAEAAARTAPGQLTVQATRTTALHASPGGPVVARVAPRTEFGSATLLPVVRRRGSWLGVISSALPNGRLGWISTSAALVAYSSPYSVVASLRDRRVVVRHDGRVVLRFPVAVGGSTTPTPTGRFAVTDKLLTHDPASPYGCCILALSAHQPNVAQGWGGGTRVAIHATDLPGTIGTAASLGCLRAPAEDARRLVHTIPLGTVVTIRA
ncbi:MAG TPA: L,D-transpeptidase [Conexibacter sp.]|nr:L,D-transpeptidase [Conexibacter sp.]